MSSEGENDYFNTQTRLINRYHGRYLRRSQEKPMPTIKHVTSDATLNRSANISNAYDSQCMKIYLSGRSCYVLDTCFIHSNNIFKGGHFLAHPTGIVFTKPKPPLYHVHVIRSYDHTIQCFNPNPTIRNHLTRTSYQPIAV